MEPPPEIEGVPPKLRTWLNKMRAFCISIQPLDGVGARVEQTDKGRPINARGNGEGSGGGGDYETVTGAVNGVPSTLNVATDGAGWTAV